MMADGAPPTGIGASAIGWVLAEQVFRMAYVPALLPVLVAVVLGAAGVVAGGWLGTRALLNRPPLAKTEQPQEVPA